MAYDATFTVPQRRRAREVNPSRASVRSRHPRENPNPRVEEKRRVARFIQQHRVTPQHGSDEQFIRPLGRDRQSSVPLLPPDFISGDVFVGRTQEETKGGYGLFPLSQEKKKGEEEKGESKKKEFYPKPLFIGIEAPQGLGKSTLVDVLQTLIDNSVVLSLDDLYLPREEQQDLGQKKHPGNPLLTFRGNPGTHDLPLARETIKKLKSINEGLGDGQTTVALPRYNKKACNGRGDRLPREDWPSVSELTDIVFLEGWCLGFERPREFESLISSVDARVYFAPINEYLMEYESVFNNVIDSWMIIKNGDWRWAYEWRQEQERKNNGGLTDAQVRDFVDRFAPTYDACLQNLHDKVESKRLEDSRSAMLIEVNKDRS